MVRTAYFKVFAVLAIALSSVYPAPAQQVTFFPVARDIIESRLRQAPRKDVDRKALIEKMFRDSGCSDGRMTEQAVVHQKLPNVICVLPGQTEEQIVIGAHMDHVTAGEGVVDNWSGASLLPSLLDALRETPRHHTFVFVAFSAEEKGLVGSRFFVSKLSDAEKTRTEGMVNLDTLGLSPTKVWVTQADPKLVKALAAVAASMKLPATEFDVDGAGSADSVSFQRAGIPSITIHSVTRDTFKVLHSSRDNLSAIRLDDYYSTYRLLSAYLAYLDQVLGPRVPTPRPTMGTVSSR